MKMDTQLDELLWAMAEYDGGDPHRIQHFLKVHAFAAFLGRQAQLAPDTQRILEAAALVHDIGIRPALARYGSDAGPLQEREGPPEARRMLERLGFDAALTDRVCTLVGRHHTYTGIDGPDCQLLIEADFLVNLHENGASREAVLAAREQIFRSDAGIRMLNAMFAV